MNDLQKVHSIHISDNTHSEGWSSDQAKAVRKRLVSREHTILLRIQTVNASP
jgi:hypothetical protein